MLELTAVRTGYGRLEVIHGMDGVVADNEFVAILGANGAGKSTLLRTCAGHLRVWSGSISFNGVPVTSSKPHQMIRRGVSYAMEGRRVFRRQTVEANLELGAYIHGGRNERTEHVFERVFDLFPVLRRKARHRASSLSGGERQMLGIAQALMTEPRLLILDEPSAGLAPLLVEEMFGALADLRGDGLSLLIAEQRVEHVLRLCDRGYVLEAGAVALTGSSSDLMQHEGVRRVYMGAPMETT